MEATGSSQIEFYVRDWHERLKRGAKHSKDIFSGSLKLFVDRGGGSLEIVKLIVLSIVHAMAYLGRRSPPFLRSMNDDLNID